MNNLEDTPQTSRAAGHTQTGSSGTTVFGPSSPKRARTGENVSVLTEHTVSQIQSLPCCSLNYKASGLKQSLHGVINQLKLLTLFLKRGLDKGYTFRLTT
jgi:hypothetical protein